jgi:membrane-bound serine protease (ClpP class)
VTVIGILLLVLGLALMVAEAHVPSGVLAVGGALVLLCGAAALVAGGLSAAVAIPVGVVAGASAGGWAVLVARKATQAQRTRVRSGSEGLAGRVGVLRAWSEPEGQVFVDGALWRARHGWEPAEDGGPLHEGDRVVVERVSGLTLSVRRAEEWELIA